MKMPKDRIAEIRSVINDYVDHVGIDKVMAYSVRVNPKRFRWDLFWNGCRYRTGGLSFDLYADGIDDTHVDTVLRHVTDILNLTIRKVV
jgi:hypothetical protein